MLAHIKSYLIDRFFIKKPWLRKRVTRWLYGTANARVRLFGADLTVNAARENGYLRAFRKAAYSSVFRDEVSGFLALAHVLREGDCFVDVGANIGLYSSVVARLPGVKVVALEANPDTYRRLEENALTHHFEAVHIAVSDQPGELEFVEGAVSHVFAVSEHRTVYNTSETVKVRSARLDEILSVEEGPFILKIDVEDHEPQVLAGASGLLEVGRIHAVLLDVSQKSAEAASQLRSKGFHVLDADTFSEPTAATAVFLAIHPSRCPTPLLKQP
jgi:FkbM family methyltransferase